MAMFFAVELLCLHLDPAPQAPFPTQCDPQATVGVMPDKTQQVPPRKATVHGGKIQPGEVLFPPAPRHPAAQLGPVQVDQVAARCRRGQGRFIQVKVADIEIPVVDPGTVHSPAAVSEFADQAQAEEMLRRKWSPRMVEAGARKRIGD